VYLVVVKGKHRGALIPIQVDLFLIGSARECQLQAQLPGTAARHCALLVRDNNVFVRDLGSGLPTLVNSTLVPPGEERPLHKGDRLEVGPFAFLVEFQEKALSQRDLEDWALRSLERDRERRRGREDTDDLDGPLTRKMMQASEAAAVILERLSAQRGEVLGRLRISQEGPVKVVRLNDVYLVEEAEVALVRRELYDNLGGPNLRVLLDFKSIKRMSTAAVVMVDELSSWLKPWGSTLALCRLRPEVEEVMKELTLRNAIPVFPDKWSALSARW
jgi:pSer/pThr/pTyr-binding forkhead associated (FHA) protein